MPQEASAIAAKCTKLRSSTDTLVLHRARPQPPNLLRRQVHMNRFHLLSHLQAFP
jgi:hypothetical protein